MSHGAQCMLCRTARWRGNQVIGCSYLEDDQHASSRVTIAVQSLLYRASRDSPCAARERVYVGPDAYLAQDVEKINSGEKG